MSKPVKLSYSAANTFKACPTKYYLSKQYQSTGRPSYFAFGTAVEAGVTAMFKGADLKDSIAEFDRNWETENVDQPSRASPIFDNPEVEYFKSDLDESLLVQHADLIKDWATELVPEEFNATRPDKDGKAKVVTWQSIIAEIYSDFDNGYKVSLERKRFYARIHWLSLAERAALMLTALWNDIMPDFEYLVEIDGVPACQYRVSITNNDGDEIVGYVDYVVKFKSKEFPVVLDCKTAAAEYTSHNINTSEQLKTYASALSKKIGSLDVGYLVLVKKLKNDSVSCDTCGHVRPHGSKARNCTQKDCKGSYLIPKLKAVCQLLTKTMKESELDSQMEDYSNVLVAVKNEINFKNPNSCMQYGRRCEFYDHCWNGKPLDKIKEIKPKHQKGD
jgi:hypothetical protein